MALIKESDYVYRDSAHRYTIAKNISGTGGWIVCAVGKFVATANSVEEAQLLAENHLQNPLRTSH